ncbi:hypothetical protein TNCV_2709431 [Trichonephila clavipes]|nr:hypothetical protein TNCV_2709431 [Trichonephila clavipes]
MNTILCYFISIPDFNNHSECGVLTAQSLLAIHNQMKIWRKGRLGQQSNVFYVKLDQGITGNMRSLLKDNVSEESKMEHRHQTDLRNLE